LLDDGRVLAGIRTIFKYKCGSRFIWMVMKSMA
jgi:hypothetical protein